MEAFTTLTSTVLPLEATNVDTDQIIPGRFLKYPRKDGYGRFLFHDFRFAADGSERMEFLLNRAPYRSARILIANTNFGCGSSREGAVYALFDYGFRCVVAPSFGDIFYNNCLGNGLLAVRLPAGDVAEMRAMAAEQPDASFTVDLPNQWVVPPSGRKLPFDLNAFRKTCLTKGLDDIGFTIQHRTEIDAFRARYLDEHHWLQPRKPSPGIPIAPSPTRHRP